MTQTVAYVRVSTDDQSTDSQRDAIERFASAERIVIDRWYADEGVTGTTLDRPELNALRADVRAGQVRLIVLYALDRLSRTSFVDGLTLLREFLAHDCRVRVIEPDADFHSDMGQLMASIMLWYAECDYKTRRSRCLDGIEIAKRKMKEARRLHRAGWGIGTIAKFVGKSPDIVQRMIDAPRGRAVWWGRGSHTERVAVDADNEIRRLANKGLGNPDIAKILGVSLSTVQRRLRRMGGKLALLDDNAETP